MCFFTAQRLAAEMTAVPIFGRKNQKGDLWKEKFYQHLSRPLGVRATGRYGYCRLESPVAHKTKNIDAGTSAYGCKKERERLRSRLLSTAIN